LADSNADHLLRLPAYDLVVAHDVPVFALAMLLRKSWNCPLVCDLHEVFPEQDEHFTTATARDYWRRAESAGLKAADGIIYVNSAVAEYVRDRHAPAAPGVVIHNAVPFVDRALLGAPTLRDYYPIPERARIMLFAGSLLPMKNLENLIEGFGLARLDGWVLALLGEGSLQEALEQMVRRAGLEDRIYLGRRAAERDLIQLTASADIGLLPYIGSGFNNLIATPNKLFEYIQARVPIATSRLPMIEQILTAHGNGGFVDYSSPASTATGLRDFVARRLPDVTQESTEAAAVEFCWENEELRLLRFFDSIIGPPRA
jgi:glycosyltransferase involved in cell wall biosynthesis